MAKNKPDFEEVPPSKMIPISVKLNPTVLENMEAVRTRIKQNRNAYINLAIDAFNHYQRYKMVKDQITFESFETTPYYRFIIQELESINDYKLTQEF